MCRVRRIVCLLSEVCPPHRGESWSHHRRPCATRRGRKAKGRAYVGGHEGATKGFVEAGVLHLVSLQRGSLILREDCYNVVTRAPTVGNDCVLYPTASERRECMLALCSSGYSQRWRW